MSLDEGFGIPVLEALHFGAPVVVSDIPVFREILGDRATFVSPLDLGAVAAAIERPGRQAPRPAPVDPADLGYTWEPGAARGSASGGAGADGRGAADRRFAE